MQAEQQTSPEASQPELDDSWFDLPVLNLPKTKTKTSTEKDVAPSPEQLDDPWFV